MTNWVKNLSTYLLCVLIAAIIWFAHAMNSIRSANIPVEISYSDLPQGIQLNHALPKVVVVEVRDAGYRLQKYKEHPMHLSFNLTEQAQCNDTLLEISSNTIRTEVSTMLLGTSKLQNILPDGISCSYTKIKEKQ